MVTSHTLEASSIKQDEIYTKQLQQPEGPELG